MTGLKRFRPSPALVVSVVALTVAFGGVAWAAIPDSSGVIHGCYQRDHGQLRLIDTDQNQSCNPSEVPIQWSQTGPQGQPGPQGAQGPQGQQGPQGDPGPGVKTVSGFVYTDGSTYGGGFTVTHPATGEYVITFPAGEFSRFAGMGITGFGINGAVPVVNLASATVNPTARSDTTSTSARRPGLTHQRTTASASWPRRPRASGGARAVGRPSAAPGPLPVRQQWLGSPAGTVRM